MRIKSLVVAMTAVASLSPIVAHAQAEENPWMVRVRAVDALWQNGQSNGSGAAAGLGNIGKLTLNPWMPAVGVAYKF